MSETLMTDQAATTTEGAESSQPAEQTATGAEQQSQQQTAEVKSDEGQKPQVQQPEVKAEEVKAPEKYEFKPVEGATVTQEVLSQFEQTAKELNLTNDVAQKVLDSMAPAIAKHQAEQLQSISRQWAEQSTVDKEFGGEKLQENLTLAKKALETFGSPELRALFDESGLGNHPEVIRFMYRAGKAVSEDKFIAGGKGGASAKASAKALYSNTEMNP